MYGGPAILPAGKKQCFEAGRAFRQRYLDPQTCNNASKADDTCLTPPGGGARYGLMGQAADVSYSNYVLLANSSALHRTVLSATSFFLGAFGGQHAAKEQAPPYLAVPMGPVFTVSEGQDVAIRAYNKCPAYDRKLARWFASDEFQQKEAETEAVRARVAELAPGLNTSLAQFWNVYDSFNVWRTYRVGEPMPELPADLYQSITDIAAWLETSKARSGLAGNLLGGVLLADLLGLIEAAGRAVRDGFPSVRTTGRQAAWLAGKSIVPLLP